MSRRLYISHDTALAAGVRRRFAIYISQPSAVAGLITQAARSLVTATNAAG
jgi:hypothetical protein